MKSMNKPRPKSAVDAIRLNIFYIGSVPGFPASLLSPATTDVVLSEENHTHLMEAATLDRKSGEADGSAVPRTSPGSAE
jgi:hypothetical protein